MRSSVRSSEQLLFSLLDLFLSLQIKHRVAKRFSLPLRLQLDLCQALRIRSFLFFLFLLPLQFLLLKFFHEFSVCAALTTNRGQPLVAHVCLAMAFWTPGVHRNFAEGLRVVRELMTL